MPKDKSKYKKAEPKEAKKSAKSTGKGEKFADMSDTAVIVDEPNLNVEEKKVKKEIKVRGKKYLEMKKLVDRSRSYTIKEALELLKKISIGKFDHTVEAHFNVIEKGLAGDANLPFFKGKAKNVVIFDENAVKELSTGKINFDILLATPADMPKILPFAKLLGPKGLMPNPKNGTLVPDPKKALSNFSGNALHFKTEKDFPLIHIVFGKLSQPTEELLENFQTLVKAVNSKNIKKAYLKSTMSPSVKVALSA